MNLRHDKPKKLVLLLPYKYNDHHRVKSKLIVVDTYKKIELKIALRLSQDSRSSYNMEKPLRFSYDMKL